MYVCVSPHIFLSFTYTNSPLYRISVVSAIAREREHYRYRPREISAMDKIELGTGVKASARRTPMINHWNSSEDKKI